VGDARPFVAAAAMKEVVDLGESVFVPDQVYRVDGIMNMHFRAAIRSVLFC
jgi:hypothetical protein